MTHERALVTGATGQDGSYLVEELVRAGAEVHALVRPSSAGTLPNGVHEHTGDLGDGAGLEALVAEVEPTEVYSLGGVSSVAQSWSEPALTAQVTGVAVVHLLRASLDLQERTGRPVRVVQASSAEIFGRAAPPQDERSPVDPVTPYGAAKAFAHHAVGVYRRRGLHASTCILFNHESPRRPETFVTRKITMGVARVAAGLQDRLALGNLDARRDWGWAPDYSHAMVLALRHDEPDDFVVATGVARSVREFVGAAFRAVGVTDWESLVVSDPEFDRPSDTPEQRGDASRAREVLGWAPTATFDDVVTRMVQHDRALVRTG